MTDLQIPYDAALDTVIAHWNDAARAWDPAALSALYSDDVLLFGGRPGHSVGKAGILAYFESYRGVILSASLRLSDQQILKVGETALLAQGYGNFAFMLAGDKATQQAMRTTLLIEAQDVGMRIRTHHFSPMPAAPPLGD